MSQPINYSTLAKLLRHQRKKLRLSFNQLSKLTGLSRRTLARIESGFYKAQGTKHEARNLSPRIAMRLAKALLPPDRVEQVLSRATKPPEPYDLLPDLYPAFLFHHAPSPYREAWEREFARDYAGSFHRLIRFSPRVGLGLETRNLGRRLRVFRLPHDLTLAETAYLLDLSKSELHRLERAERQASPRTRYRILRLLTLPLPPVVGPAHPASRLRREPAGGARKERSDSVSAGLKPGPAKTGSRVASRRARREWLERVKLLLSLPPPEPIEFDNDPDGLHRLRYLWLAGERSSKQLAAELQISPPHLIRLLRGDRRPSRRLRERLAQLLLY